MLRGLRLLALRLVPQDWQTALFLVVLLAGSLAVAALVHSVPTGRPEPTRVVRPPTPVRAATPAELPERGAFVTAHVQFDGTIQVTHWIRSRTPVASVVAVVPDTVLPAGLPRAENVQVDSVAGAPLAGAADIEAAPEMIELRRPRRVARLTYELSGVVDQSSSLTGRALAGVTFLDVDYVGRAGPTRVRVVGDRVLNLGCVPDSADATPRPCGEPEGSGWSVTVPDPDQAVAAQLDLGEVTWDE